MKTYEEVIQYFKKHDGFPVLETSGDDIIRLVRDGFVREYVNKGNTYEVVLKKIETETTPWYDIEEITKERFPDIKVVVTFLQQLEHDKEVCIHIDDKYYLMFLDILETSK